MCGSEAGWIWGGLIVAGAMLVWSFASSGDAAQRAHQSAPAKHAESTMLTVSADGVALSFEGGGLTVRLSL